MSQELIGVGASANDGTGDPARTAFQKCNANFAELYGLTGVGWDDHRFPATGINPTGAVNAPEVDTTLAGVTGTLLFSGAQQNVLAFLVQMPHSWYSANRGGSGLVIPHIHWTLPTGSADAVTWEFHYRIIGDVGDPLGAWSGAVAPAGTVGDLTAGDRHCLTYWDPLDLSAYTASMMIACRIHRRGDTDANAGQARLYECDFHLQFLGFGTPDQYPGSPQPY